MATWLADNDQEAIWLRYMWASMKSLPLSSLPMIRANQLIFQQTQDYVWKYHDYASAKAKIKRLDARMQKRWLAITQDGDVLDTEEAITIQVIDYCCEQFLTEEWPHSTGRAREYLNSIGMGEAAFSQMWPEGKEGATLPYV